MKATVKVCGNEGKHKEDDMEKSEHFELATKAEYVRNKRAALNARKAAWARVRKNNKKENRK